MTTVCPACHQPVPDPAAVRRLTDRELEVLSAWWQLHTTRAVARFLGVAEQTVKQHLYNARRRNGGLHSSADLAQMYMAELLPMDVLMTQHNNRRVAA